LKLKIEIKEMKILLKSKIEIIELKIERNKNIIESKDRDNRNEKREKLKYY
jgi:hypothetical protein